MELLDGASVGADLQRDADVVVVGTGAGGAVESHLIGFTGDLYGRRVEVRFVDRLRDERRFESVEELKERIALDISRALEILKS